MSGSFNVTLIMSMTSGGREVGLRQLGCAPMVASRHINHGISTVVPGLTSLVPQSTVNPFMYDSKQEEDTSIRAYRDGFSLGSRAVIGAARSAVSTVLSLLGAIDSVPMCSYWSSSPSLSNKALYPLFGRTYPSDATTTQALPQLIKSKGWSTIGVIHTNDAYANAYAQGLRTNSPAAGVTVVATASFERNQFNTMESAVTNIRNSGVNIIVAVVFEADGAALAYEANRQGLIGENYVWITTDALTTESVTVDATTDQDLARQLMNGWLNFYASPSGSDGFSRFTDAWAQETDATCANENFNISEFPDVFGTVPSPEHTGAFAYDCMVALAAAMHAAGPTATGEEVYAHFKNVTFEGATGIVAFDDNGDRLASTVRFVLDNWVDTGTALTNTAVGAFTISDGLSLTSTAITWPGGSSTVPTDNFIAPNALCTSDDYEYTVSECEDMKRTVVYNWTNTTICTINRELPASTTINCEYLQDDEPVVFAMYAIAAIPITLFVVTLLMVKIHRNEPAIKQGQPIFLYIMSAGGIVALLPIFLIPGEPSNTNCFTPSVLAVLGYTLTFGCLLLKTCVRLAFRLGRATRPDSSHSALTRTALMPQVPHPPHFRQQVLEGLEDGQ